MGERNAAALASFGFEFSSGSLFSGGAALRPGQSLESGTFRATYRRSEKSGPHVAVFDGPAFVGCVRLANGEWGISVVMEGEGREARSRLHWRHVRPIAEEPPLRRGLRELGIMPRRGMIVEGPTAEWRVRQTLTNGIAGGTRFGFKTDGQFTLDQSVTPSAHRPREGKVVGGTYCVSFEARGQKRWLDRVMIRPEADIQAVVGTVADVLRKQDMHTVTKPQAAAPLQEPADLVEPAQAGIGNMGAAFAAAGL